MNDKIKKKDPPKSQINKVSELPQEQAFEKVIQTLF